MGFMHQVFNMRGIMTCEGPWHYNKYRISFRSLPPVLSFPKRISYKIQADSSSILKYKLLTTLILETTIDHLFGHFLETGDHQLGLPTKAKPGAIITLILNLLEPFLKLSRFLNLTFVFVFWVVVMDDQRVFEIQKFIQHF
jgi:hypothetical protein